MVLNDTTQLLACIPLIITRIQNVKTLLQESHRLRFHSDVICVSTATAAVILVILRGIELDVAHS